MSLKKQNTRILIRVVISALLVGFFFTRVDVSKVLLSFREFSFFAAALSVALYLFAFWVVSLKWKILLPDYPLSLLFKLNLVGLFYSTVLPGQISGEVVKTYRLSRNSTEAEKIVASVWVDKITGLLGLLLVGIVGMFFTPTQLPESLVAGIILVTFLCFALLFFIRIKWCALFAEKFLRGVSSRFPRLDTLNKKLVLFMSLWRDYLHQGRKIFLSVLFGAMFQLVAVGIVMVLAHGAGITVSFWDWCWIFGAVSMALLLPITIGGLGLRDGVLVGLLVWLHVPAEHALVLSLSLFGLQVVVAAIGGILELTSNSSRT
jgi:uncharacterized protein (TIRG00374 family)